MKQITFMILWVALLAGGYAEASMAADERKPTRPNILWIVADDLGADLGTYGDPNVHTPNLDKLAAEGTRYDNFYTVTAVCSPSRSAFITGMYPTSINSHQHRTRYKQPLPEGVYPITHYFKKAGYFTSNGVYSSREKAGKQDYNFTANSIYDGTDWSQRAEGQPFFSQVQIFFPHRPFKRDAERPVDERDIQLPPYYPDHRVARQDWALYLEYIQLLDKEVGKILQRLEDEGLADNTIVFFFGDQGRPHVRAKQFLYDAGIHSPLIVRGKGVPRSGKPSDRMVSNIDLGPTAMRIAGIDVPGHIQGQDFLQPRKEREYIVAMRDRRDETVDRIRAIRTKKYKYIRNFYPERPYTQFNAYKKQAYPVLTLMQVLHKQGKLTAEQAQFMAETRPPEELYYLPDDPHELRNLVNDPKHQATLSQMRERLDQWLEEADKGKYPEDPAEIKYAEDLMKKRFVQQMKKKGLQADTPDEEFLEYWEKVLTPTEKKETN